MKYKIIQTDLMHNGALLKENAIVEFTTPPAEFSQFLLPVVEQFKSTEETIYSEDAVDSSPNKRKPKKSKGIIL